MEINKQFIANRKVYPGTTLKTPTYITIHSTANNATAQNERDNLNRPDNTRKASFHYAVDDVQIVQCLPDNLEAWHAGTKAQHCSLAIEICEIKNLDKAIANAENLTANLMKHYGIPISRVVRHYDWTGKICPRIMQDNKWARWKTFKKNVEKNVEKLVESVEDDEMKYYESINEIPSGEMRNVVNLMIQKGAIKGTGTGLHLSEDMIRLMVYNQRMGLYK